MYMDVPRTCTLPRQRGNYFYNRLTQGARIFCLLPSVGLEGTKKWKD